VLLKIPNFNEGSATSGGATDSPLEIPKSDLDPGGARSDLEPSGVKSLTAQNKDQLEQIHESW
jgi:hypothetical protein